MISIVLPVHNQKSMLPNLKKVISAMDKLKEDYEIIIAEDGSTDGSAEKAADIAKKHKKIRHLHSDERLGRGRALKRAFKKAKGEYIFYMDADLATDLKALPIALDALSENDVVIGSRYHSESETKRSWKRLFLSRGYNLLVKVLTGEGVDDFQCGFKGFRKEFIGKVIGEVKDNGWFWDTEIVVLAKRKGYNVKEIPVKWTESKDSTVILMDDSFRMGTKAFKLGYRLRTGR